MKLWTGNLTLGVAGLLGAGMLAMPVVAQTASHTKARTAAKSHPRSSTSGQRRDAAHTSKKRSAPATRPRTAARSHPRSSTTRQRRYAAHTSNPRAASSARAARAKSAHRRPLSPRQIRARLKPAPGRVQEIQQALVKAGYLNEEPNGVWDDRTREAMRRYQAENGFPATGLPEAKSLMKLGLGPHPLPPELHPAAQVKAEETPSEHSTSPPSSEDPKKDVAPSAPAPPSSRN